MGTSAVSPPEANSHRLPQGVDQLTIGQYLIRRLQDYGLRDLFGIPGDYVLDFYTQLTRSPIRVVTCTREDAAGFAADAYARVQGFGAVCVTYCVGGLSCCNSIAGAYAEKSPVLLISGSPGLRERYNNPLLHHKVAEFQTQYEVYRRLTVAQAELTDPTIAFREIDRVLEAIVRHKRPGYIELPRDLVNVRPGVPHTPRRTEPASDPAALREAIAETVRRVHTGSKAVIIAGVEIHRYGLQDSLLKLVEGANIPFVTTALGKSVISEMHPLYAGLYEGALGRQDVAKFVEESDTILLLGEFMTDINSGVYTAKLDPHRCVHATSESLQISHHHFRDVLLGDFLDELSRSGLRIPARDVPPQHPAGHVPFAVAADAPLTISRLVERLNVSLDENTIVVADVGDALFSSMELVIHKQTKYLAPAYYTSMGFAVPAAVGVSVAQPNLRPIVLVGDGAFQMTGMELSTVAKIGCKPIVILLNNRGFGTERFLHEGEFEFNDIHSWAYHKLPEVLQYGVGHEVFTEGDFDRALTAALKSDTLALIHVHLDVKDAGTILRRLAERLIPKLDNPAN